MGAAFGLPTINVTATFNHRKDDGLAQVNVVISRREDCPFESLPPVVLLTTEVMLDDAVSAHSNHAALLCNFAARSADVDE